MLPIGGMPAVAAGDRVDIAVEIERTGILAWSASWSRNGKRLGEAVQNRALQMDLVTRRG